MIPALGEFALWIALPIAIWGCVLAFLGGRWSRGDLVLSGERSTYAVFFLLALASAGIITLGNKELFTKCIFEHLENMSWRKVSEHLHFLCFICSFYFLRKGLSPTFGQILFPQLPFRDCLL